MELSGKSLVFLLKKIVGKKGIKMNSLTQRLLSCAAIGAIFTLLALASGQNYWLVALAFISGIACGWISADLRGFTVAVKDRLAVMKAETHKKLTPYEKGMRKINRAYALAGLRFFGVLLGQAIFFGQLFCYVFVSGPDISPIHASLPGQATFGVSCALPVVVLMLIWLFKQPDPYTKHAIQHKRTIRDTRVFRYHVSLLSSHGWLPFYILGIIKVLARIIEAIPMALGWLRGHFVGLIKSAHTDGRLVSSTCVAFGMVIGYAVGLKTDSLLLGTIGGGVGGALFALVDWYVLSVMLGWREKTSAPSSN